MPTLQETQERVAEGRCITYSASTGQFCSVEGKHVIHNFNTFND